MNAVLTVKPWPFIIKSFLVTVVGWMTTTDAAAGMLTCEIVDDESGQRIPARVYLQSSAGEWLFVRSAAREGTALPYREQWVPMASSVEKHTTVSAHPFQIDLAAGEYTLTVERGKEYLSHSEVLKVQDEPLRHVVRLKRWINLAARGWYSGETHVHRRIQELPNVMQAEDLNVAFPVTFWTVNAYSSPDLEPSPLRRQGPSPFGQREDRGTERIPVDATHVIIPRNTEYEIFSVGEERHVLGAIFVLNHKTRFTKGMPPVARIARQAHEEGALLDLDKHTWPWSMMLVPIARVDLYELSNNSVWRTKFGFRRSQVPIADYMGVQTDEDGLLTERGWLEFGFQNYYSLLNCGFRIQPTAGTASGVHPVPLGYSRVYVHTGERFSVDRWLEGLRDGHSFVSTGPMLFATLNDQQSGSVSEAGEASSFNAELKIRSVSPEPIARIEIIVNGEVHTVFRQRDLKVIRDGHAFVANAKADIEVDRTSWIAVRSFQDYDGDRVQFAHTAPWHIQFGDTPIRPRKEEIDYLIKRVEAELGRNRSVLKADALKEFEAAVEIYRSIRDRHYPSDK